MKQFAWLVFFLVCAAPANAEKVAPEAPAQASRLLWNGTDVPPLCFDKLLPMEGEGPESVDIAECEKIEGINKLDTHADNGVLTTSYGDTEEGTNGFVSYKVIGTVPEGYVIKVTLNGGGTGMFSSVQVVNLDGDKLVWVKSVGGVGDRCNGGVADARILPDNKIEVASHITPGDFAAIAYNNDGVLIPYKDLEASAASCVARLVTVDDNPVRIELDKDISNENEEWIARYRYQSCFNRHFKEQVQRKDRLTLEEFKNFMDGFMADCVKK